MLFRSIPSGEYPATLAFIIFCGLTIAIALFFGARLLKNILAQNPFARSNQFYLQIDAACAFMLSLAFALKMLFSSSLLTFMCLFLFLGAGIFLLVLSELFAAANEIKEENELTI